MLSQDGILELQNQSSTEFEMFKKRVLEFIKTEYKSDINDAKVAFVDIETTGLSRDYHDITVLGIYDGINAITYVNGQNLNEAIDHLKQFNVIVTFNGKCFDMPFIEAKFGKTHEYYHLDLRYLLKEFGLAGGLKKIEVNLGITRGEEIAGIDGFEAVNLWHRYKRGDFLALDKLLKYNREDIVNLKILLDYYLNRKFC